MSASTFPLPRDFFRCPPLSAKEIEYFTKLGQDACVRAIRTATNLRDGPIIWTLESSCDETKVYSGIDPRAPPQFSVWGGETEVRATIDEVAQRFKSESTDEFLDFSRTFAKDVMDAANLYNIVRSTPDNPHHAITIKWFAQGTPLPSLIKARDYCFLDSCHEFTLDGRRGWAQTHKSIMLPNCPDLLATLGLIRADIYASAVFLESPTRPGYVRMVHTCHLNLNGMVPKWLYSRSIKLRCAALRDFELLLQESRMRHALPTLRSEHELIPHAQRSRCFACHRSFGLFASKQNCLSCGEVMCRNCVRWFDEKASRMSLCLTCSKAPAPTDSQSGKSQVNRPSMDDSALYLSLDASSDTNEMLLTLEPPLGARQLYRSNSADWPMHVEPSKHMAYSDVLFREPEPIDISSARYVKSVNLKGSISLPSSAASSGHPTPRDPPRNDLIFTPTEARRNDLIPLPTEWNLGSRVHSS
ncbi:hypothetical protein LEN26_009469 [Aphanomyces euteiches]|nr:hypothetical protein LEN26_009469 [Aphanomyces euteiches]